MIIRAPAKPTATAAQRRGPTRSPSNGTESAVTISGAVNMIAEAVARATVVKAAMKNQFDANMIAERPNWISGCSVCSSRHPRRGQNNSAMKAK